MALVARHKWNAPFWSHPGGVWVSNSVFAQQVSFLLRYWRIVGESWLSYIIYTYINVLLELILRNAVQCNMMWWRQSGTRLNIKTFQGRVPIIKIRRSWDRLIFIMRTHILHNETPMIKRRRCQDRVILLIVIRYLWGSVGCFTHSGLNFKGCVASMTNYIPFLWRYLPHTQLLFLQSTHIVI